MCHQSRALLLLLNILFHQDLKSRGLLPMPILVLRSVLRITLIWNISLLETFNDSYLLYRYEIHFEIQDSNIKFRKMIFAFKVRENFIEKCVFLTHVISNAELNMFAFVLLAENFKLRLNKNKLVQSICIISTNSSLVVGFVPTNRQ